MIMIEEVSTLDDFQKMKNEWDDLVLKSNSDNIFLTFDWLMRWCRYFLNDSKLFILKVIENKQLIGMAPLMIKKRRFFGMPVRTISFIGTGVSDRMDFILAESKVESLNAILNYVMKNSSRWDVIDLQEMPDYTDNSHILRNCLEGLKLPVINGPDNRCFYVSIDGDRKSFLKSASRKVRHKLVNANNKVKKTGTDFIFNKFINNTGSAEHLLSEIERIEKASWKGLEKKGHFSSDNRLGPFHREIIMEYVKKGLVDVSFLSLGDKNVAYIYSFFYGNKLYAYSSSYDAGYIDLSPGFVLFVNSIGHSYDCKMREFDFMKGDEIWKQRLTPHYRVHARTRIFKETVYSKFIYIMQAHLLPYLRSKKISTI